MFKLESSDGYWYSVPVEQRDENGKLYKQFFDLRFKRMKQSEMLALVEKMKANEINDVDLLCTLALNWRKVSLDGVSETPFSDTAAREFFDQERIARAVVAAWMESVTPTAKAKN